MKRFSFWVRLVVLIGLPVSLCAQISSPLIVTSPVSQTNYEGSTITFSVVVTGSLPLAYQWVHNGTNVLGPTATTANLVLDTISTNDAGGYAVSVSNTYGSASSTTATLTVIPYPARRLRLADYQVETNGHARVWLELTALGNENAVASTLDFDPAVLTNAVVTNVLDLSNTNIVVPPPDATNTNPALTFRTDTTALAQGRLGLQLVLPPGWQFTAGTNRLAEVDFDLIHGQAPAAAGLGFGNDPVPTAITDVASNALEEVSEVLPALASPPGPPTLDRQSGLFLQTLAIINPGNSDLATARLLVHGLGLDSLTNQIRLWNLAGVWNGSPYVQYGPLSAGGSIQLTLQYYVSDRLTVPTPQFEFQSVPASIPVNPAGFILQVDREEFTNGVMVVEFTTQPAALYQIEYTSDLNSTNWNAVPSTIPGTGSRVQWIDRGPPDTPSPPTSQTNRFYRVVQLTTD